LEDNNLQDIESELQSLIGMIHTRVELEKGIGIDVMDIHHTQGGSKRQRAEGQGERPVAPTLKGEGESKAQRLLALKQLVLECRKCGLCKDRKNVVFGSGNPEADLMFVGEAPGRDEDMQGEPFVGRAGQLLTKIIEAIKLDRKEVYIANILKCRPPGNRSPRGEEIVLCFPHLIKQIEIIRPKIICALGAFAAQTLLNTKESIGSLRGRFHDYSCSERNESKDIKLLATYHPAYLLRNPNDKAKTWEDMKKVRDMLLKIKKEYKNG
jgi:DNA polymerase